MTEEFTFEECFRDGGTIHFDKRLSGTGAGIVDRIGDQLLSCSALTPDEDRGLAGRHPSNQSHHLLHFKTSINNILEGISLLKPCLEIPVFPDQGGPFQHFLDDEKEFIKIDRFGQVVERARFHRCHSRFNRSVSGHHHHRKVREVFSDFKKGLEAVEFRHLIVEEGDVEKSCPNLLNSLFAIGRGLY